MKNLLIIEDDQFQLATLAGFLESRYKAKVKRATNGADAVAYIHSNMRDPIDLVVLDLGLPDINGHSILKILQQDEPQTPVIVLTAEDDPDLIIETMRMGAFDFVTKPPSQERLTVSIEKALQINDMRSELAELKSKLSTTEGFSDIVGVDGALSDVCKQAARAAQSNIPVLISGETGSGKELLARAIHNASPRRDGPFIALNCGAIPKELVESTLFGHEKGAFTGAIRKEKGHFRNANGGTLFLDEIGDLAYDAQVKLLRTLQMGEVTPVGGVAPVDVNVRVISASHRHIPELIEKNNFREDLFYRINAVQLSLPSLANRKEDIRPLAEYFLNKFCQEEDHPVKYLSDDAIEFLEEHPWPGNVRQLENTLYKAVIFSQNPEITREDLLEDSDPGSQSIFEGVAPDGSPLVSPKTHVRFMDDSKQIVPLKDVELEIIKRAYDHYNGNLSKAARALGISRATYYRKLNLDAMNGETDGEMMAEATA